MKIGIIAGTPIDTKMGAEVLKEASIDYLEFPLSLNAREQTLLQYSGQKHIEQETEILIRKAIENKCDGILIYCNSLSSSIDYKKIEKNLNIPIITPLECYYEYSKKYNTLAVLCANGNSAREIERILKKSNKYNNSILIGNMMLVEAIESNISKENIIKTLALDSMIDFLEKIDYNNHKVEAIILGCTHFPYIKDKLEKITNIKILDPKDDMIKKLLYKLNKIT